MQSFKRNTDGNQKDQRLEKTIAKKRLLCCFSRGGGVICNSRSDHVSGTHVSKTSIWYHKACKKWVTCCMSSDPCQGSESDTPTNSFTESKHWNIYIAGD